MQLSQLLPLCSSTDFAWMTRVDAYDLPCQLSRAQGGEGEQTGNKCGTKHNVTVPDLRGARGDW